MVIRKYPDEIQQLWDLIEPYMVGATLENAPPEAYEALEKIRKWAFEQEQ